MFSIQSLTSPPLPNLSFPIPFLPFPYLPRYVAKQVASPDHNPVDTERGA